MRWISVSLFLVFFGGMTFSSVIWSGKDDSLFSFGILFVLLPICWLIYTFFTTGVTTTIINRRNRTLAVKKKTLLKNTFETYQFDDIQGSFIIVKASYGRGVYYSIELPLKNTSVQLAVPRMLNSKQYDVVVEDANRYLSDGSDNFRLTLLNVD